MVRPLAYYLDLLEAAQPLEKGRSAVLVWTAPPDGMGENTGELTQPKEGRADPHPKKGTQTLVFELDGGTREALVIGRGSACALQIRDDSVSRRHLSLVPSGGTGWAASDLGSKNGTWIGTVRLPSAATRPLEDGARIQLGNVELFFMLPPAFRDYLTQIRANRG